MCVALIVLTLSCIYNLRQVSFLAEGIGERYYLILSYIRLTLTTLRDQLFRRPLLADDFTRYDMYALQLSANYMHEISTSGTLRITCVAAPVTYKNVISTGQAFSEITDIQFLGSLCAYGYFSEDMKYAVFVRTVVSIN